MPSLGRRVSHSNVVFYFLIVTLLLLDITYMVLQYLCQDWICTALLPEWGHVNESHFYTFEAMEGTEQICLGVNFCVEKNSLVLSVFAPFWMVNQTDADIH